MDSTLSFLRDLVAIDSVNPSLVLGAAGEWTIAHRIAAEMHRVGLEDVRLTEVAPRRPNVVGVLAGAKPGRTLMLCGHMDTVGVTGMTAPFDPQERDGRLFGRGAQDMKGGVAAMVGAAAALTDAGGLPAGRLVVAAVADEEYASLGAEVLALDCDADGAVVTEPTDLVIATGHKGFTWVDVEVRGHAAHGSRPSEGRDAIAHMGRVLSGLESLDGHLQARAAHPLLGAPSVHASTIHGGGERSVYPEHCSMSLERRTVVGEPEGIALTEVEAILDRLRREDPEFEATATLTFERPAYELGANHPLPQALQSVAVAHGWSPVVTGMSFWTDAAVLDRAGIPSVLFGPRGGGLHEPDEYVELSTVLACRNALTELARVFCAEP